MEADQKYNQVSAIVEAKLDFYKSLTAFIFIVGGLATYDFYNAGQLTWSKWVIFGWGFDLILKWHSAFIENGVFNEWLKNRMIKKEIQKL